ncbi:E3 ubiquitin-protein ligase SINAT3-like isoform X2 [Triticum urartu]|uniref:E3 ubiquitin-protein ligase SINAT3-like isoform X2 n=1 Tax=Triticum urartu TaxID=4572 RepID=UPI002044391E|nr:E3 ubiquitin-protein ligase SINAT3-like isoform X2 [Triticum urartu]
MSELGSRAAVRWRAEAGVRACAMDVDSIECLSLPDADMDADDVDLALHPHGGLLAAAAASHPAAYPKAAIGAVGIVAPRSSVHELLECPVCTNSMYPLIHQPLWRI